MMISSRRTEQLVIIAGFLPRHWLYKWFSQFHSCGTYLVLSRSPSNVWRLVQQNAYKPDDLPKAITTVRLTTIFQDNLGEPAPECLHSVFYWCKDYGGQCWQL